MAKIWGNWIACAWIQSVPQFFAPQSSKIRHEPRSNLDQFFFQKLKLAKVFSSQIECVCFGHNKRESNMMLGRPNLGVASSKTFISPLSNRNRTTKTAIRFDSIRAEKMDFRCLYHISHVDTFLILVETSGIQRALKMLWLIIIQSGLIGSARNTLDVLSL